MDNLYSAAFNQQNFISGGPDPRTGLVSKTITLAKLKGNGGLGPDFDLTLSFDPMGSMDTGNDYNGVTQIGRGWSFNLGGYASAADQLTLSTKQSYKVTGENGNDWILSHKQNDIQVQRSADKKTLYVAHKDGLVEVHTFDDTSNESNAHLSQLVQNDGRRLDFYYQLSGGQNLLQTIVNSDSQTLVDITYNDNQVDVTLYPSTNAEKYFSLVINSDGCLATLILPDNNTYDFLYQQMNDNMWFIAKMGSPAGQIEEMYYTSAENGHQLPSDAPVAYLPVIKDYRVIAGANQPTVLTRFDFESEYDDHNFLGYGAVGSWNDNTDNLWDIDHEYRYGVKVTVDPDGNQPKIQTNWFNKFHQLREQTETYGDGSHLKTTTYTYYSDETAILDAQPLQYEQQTSRTITFTLDEQTQTFVETSEFDTFGNQTAKTAFSGISESFEYYQATGESAGSDVLCPADPYGFVRYLKSHTRTPSAITSGTNPDPIVDQFRYTQLAAFDSAIAADYFVVQNQQSRANLGQIDYTYQNKVEDTDLHGRLIQQVLTLNDLTTTTDYIYDIQVEKITTTQTVTGFDGTTLNFSQTISRWNGKTTQEVNAQGVITDYAYEILGRVSAVTVASGTAYEAQRSYTYAAAEIDLDASEVTTSAILTTTDAKGLQAQATYDGLNRIVQIACQDTDGSLVTMRDNIYNALGQLVSETRYDTVPTSIGGIPTQISTVKSYEYNDWGKPSATIYSDGRREISQIDPFSMTEVTGIEGEGLTRTTRDLFNNPIKVEQFADQTNLDNGTPESTASSTYDGFGRKLSDTDALDNTTSYAYDVFSRVVQITLPDGTVQTNGYAAHTNQVLPISIKIDDAIFSTQSFDGLDRVVTSTVAGRANTSTYGAGSDKPASLQSPTGDTLNFSYCAELGNSLTGISSTTGISQSFDYDAVTSLLTTVNNAAQDHKITQDDAGLMQSETFNEGQEDEKTASYDYSLGGRLKQFADVLGGTHQFSYDDQGRLTDVQQDNLQANIGYDNQGRVATLEVTDVSHDKSITSTLTYDGFGRELSRTLNYTDQPSRRLEQTYDEKGHLLTRTLASDSDTLRDETFAYDERDRLTGYTSSGSEAPKDAQGNVIQSQEYTYDKWNNILTCVTTFDDDSDNTTTFTYGNLNDPTQLTEVSNTRAGYPNATLAYDAAGRMSKDEQGRDLSYDALGRLISIQHPSGGTTGYQYDAQGQLVSQTLSNGTSLKRYYRNGTVVNETLDGDPTTYFAIGSQMLARRTGNTGETIRLFGTNPQGSVMTELDAAAGTLTDRPYTPYGDQPLETDASSVGLNGELKDLETGWYLLGNGYRAYNPSLMRFNTPDSLSPFSGGGINPYVYALGNPLNQLDPSGHLSVGGDLGLNIFCLFIDLLVLGAAAASMVASGGLTTAGVIAASGALLGVTSDTLGIAADSMTIQDQKTGQDRSATEQNLGFASGIFGIVSLLVGVAEVASSTTKIAKAGIKTGDEAVRGVVAGLDELSPTMAKKSMKVGSGAEKTTTQTFKTDSLIDPTLGFFGKGAFDDLGGIFASKPMSYVIAPALTISTLISSGFLFANTTWKPATKNQESNNNSGGANQDNQSASSGNSGPAPVNPFLVSGQAARTPIALEIASN